MSRLPLSLIRAQIERGLLAPADAATLCDRVEQLEREVRELEREVRELADELDLQSQELPGRFTIILSEEAEQRLLALYDAGRLAPAQQIDLDADLYAALSAFAEGAIGLAFERARLGDRRPLQLAVGGGLCSCA
jgi:DNA-binding transcriptional LysR family regulator